jgi:hypothetical protein
MLTKIKVSIYFFLQMYANMTIKTYSLGLYLRYESNCDFLNVEYFTKN